MKGPQRLVIRLLGEESIFGKPCGAAWNQSSRMVELLEFLAVHAGAPQTRYSIACRLWPDSTDGQALTNLRRELHHLRRQLGNGPCLVVTAHSLGWRDDGTALVDVRVFDAEHRAAFDAMARGDIPAALEHADAALLQYRGELMPGRYEDWILEARAELQRRCVDLCELVSRTRAQRGELPKALEAARRRVRMEPLEEGGYRLVMELQAELGDRAGAVSTYHGCASILERELGVVPGQATRATLQRVMEQRHPAGLGLQPRMPAGRLADGQSPAVTGLVGRSGEFAVLGEAWQRAVGGRRGLAVVRGSPGVGKTALVSEISELARRSGAVVAVSQCFGTSGRLALAPVGDWLRDPQVQSATTTLDQAWRDEVDRLVPSGATRSEPTKSSRALVDAWQRHRFFEGLARALLAAGRPTLLVLDNLQWCDQETLSFLAFFLGLATPAPVLVATTLRTEDFGNAGESGEWILRLRAADVLTELTLHPLELPDTARLAESIAGRRFVQEERVLLQAATGGFPLHVVEAMRAVSNLGGSPLPAGDLAVVLSSRLEQSSETAREVVGLAAAVGRNFSLDLLVDASDLDIDGVVQAVDELWRRRILVERDGSYDFSHDLLREAGYASISPPRRWLLHRRVAQSLELLHAEDLDAVSAQLAEQYVRGGRPERAVGYYTRAAEVASGIFAHAEAIRFYSEALSLLRARPPGRESDRLQLLVLEAMAAPLNASYGYSSARLQTVLERAIELSDSLGRTDSLVSGLVGLWASQFVQGRVAEGHRTATRALQLVDAGSEHGGAAHFAFAGTAVSLGMPSEALRHFDLAAELTQGASVSVGTRPDVHGRAWAAHAHWLLGQDELALSRCQEAVQLARSIHHPYSLAVALAYAGITHQMRGDASELAATVTELRWLCDRYGFGYYREWALVLDGWCRGGHEGIELARRGIANLRAEGSFARMPYWLALLAELLARTGKVNDARSTLDAAVSSAQARADVWWLPEVQRMRALYDVDSDLAVSRLRQAAELASDHGSLSLQRRCERDLAERGVRAADGIVPPPG